MSPYYTTLSCAQTHYLVDTDPMLRRPLTDSGCMYTSYFTSTVTPEVKVEQSSEMGAEQSSDSKVEWSGVLTQRWGGIWNSGSVRWGVPWQLRAPTTCPRWNKGTDEDVKVLQWLSEHAGLTSECVSEVIEPFAKGDRKMLSMAWHGTRLQSVQQQGRSCDLPHIQPR